MVATAQMTNAVSAQSLFLMIPWQYISSVFNFALQNYNLFCKYEQL